MAGEVESGTHENHTSPAQLHPFSNDGAAMRHMRQTNEVDAHRTKRSQR